MVIVFMITCIYYAHLTSARFEHSVCRGSLTTTHINLTRILTLTTLNSEKLWYSSKVSGVAWQTALKISVSSNSALLNYSSFKVPANGTLSVSFFASFFRIAQLTWPICFHMHHLDPSKFLLTVLIPYFYYQNFCFVVHFLNFFF